MKVLIKPEYLMWLQTNTLWLFDKYFYRVLIQFKKIFFWYLYKKFTNLATTRPSQRDLCFSFDFYSKNSDSKMMLYSSIYNVKWITAKSWPPISVSKTNGNFKNLQNDLLILIFVLPNLLTAKSSVYGIIRIFLNEALWKQFHITFDSICGQYSQKHGMTLE